MGIDCSVPRWYVDVTKAGCLAWAVVLPLTLAVTLAQAQPDNDPDRLYADRANPASAERSAALWEARLARDPGDFEAAWKLARACYLAGWARRARGAAAAVRARGRDGPARVGHRSEAP